MRKRLKSLSVAPAATVSHIAPGFQDASREWAHYGGALHKAVLKATKPA